MIKKCCGLLVTDNDMLCRNIYYLRKKKRLSRIKFSDLMKMSNSMLYCIERGMWYAIEEDAAMNICEYYKITLDELFDIDLEEKYKK